MILAGIDIGTNTIRLLVADIGDAGFRELLSARVITRLGGALDRTGFLDLKAREETIATLQEYAGSIARSGATRVAAVGTSALRTASNAATFLEDVRSRTGIEIAVIDGIEEARLMLIGVRGALGRGKGHADDPFRAALVIDIGGGSTEFVATRDGSIVDAVSFPLGAVYLTDRFLHHDPPTDEEMIALRNAVRGHLDEWERGLHAKNLTAAALTVFAGTAGTITTLAAMEMRLVVYDPQQINGYVLTADALDGLTRKLSSLTIQQRKSLPGLEEGRADIVLAGAVVCQEVMRRCGKSELLVSDWGLREGIVFDLYEKCGRK